ncbi:hypothetical protein D9M68_835430 [compost metagenome]
MALASLFTGGYMLFRVGTGKGKPMTGQLSGFVHGRAIQPLKTGKQLMTSCINNLILLILMLKNGQNRRKKWVQSILFLPPSTTMVFVCGRVSIPAIPLKIHPLNEIL